VDRHDNERNRCFKRFYGPCVPGGKLLVDSLPALCKDALLDHVLRKLYVPGKSRRPLTTRNYKPHHTPHADGALRRVTEGSMCVRRVTARNGEYTSRYGALRSVTCFSCEMVDTEESRFHSKELILQRTHGGAVGHSGTPCPLLGHLSHGGTQGVTRGVETSNSVRCHR